MKSVFPFKNNAYSIFELPYNGFDHFKGSLESSIQSVTKNYDQVQWYNEWHFFPHQHCSLNSYFEASFKTIYGEQESDGVLQAPYERCKRNTKNIARSGPFSRPRGESIATHLASNTRAASRIESEIVVEHYKAASLERSDPHYSSPETPLI